MTKRIYDFKYFFYFDYFKTLIKPLKMKVL